MMFLDECPFLDEVSLSSARPRWASSIGSATSSSEVYANDHLPPHFHAVAPDVEALVAIDTLAVLEGALPRQARRTVLAWAVANRIAIAAEWNRINPRFPIA